MIKKIVFLLSIGMALLLMMTCSTTSEKEVKVETAPSDVERMAWWREAKFGLFIHWGVYAVPAGQYGDNTNYGEWIMHSARIPSAEYKEYAKQFNPTKYNPKEWVKIAREAGMRYIVITSKHHDGFALYPSDVTDWDVADASPYGKDLLGPLVDEAKKAGLKMGFYYSQAQDWNHPGGAKAVFRKEMAGTRLIKVTLMHTFKTLHCHKQKNSCPAIPWMYFGGILQHG